MSDHETPSLAGSVEIGKMKWRDGDRGARILAGSVRPTESGTAAWVGAIETITHIVASLGPDLHFISFMRTRCDGLRDGQPRGRRIHFVAVYLPLVRTEMGER